MWVNSSREHPPPRAKPRAYSGHLKKLFKCPALRAIFVGKCPAPVPSVVVKCPALQSIRSIYKVIGCHILLNITVSAQKNCIKQVTKWVNSTEKRQSKWFYCFYRYFMVAKCSVSTPKWLLETLDSERRRKWRQDGTKQVCCCLQMPGGPGHY